MLVGLDRRGLAVERANITGGDLVVDDRISTDELRTEVWALRQTKNRYHAELDRRLVEGGRSLLYRGMMLFAMLVLGALGVLVASPSSNPDDALSGFSERYVDRLIDQVEDSAYSSAESALREGD
jgi:hypothetical protein